MLFTLLLSAVICLSPFQANEVQSFEVQPDKPLGDVVSIEEALSEFEARYEKKVMIPNYVPFDPTISGGKVDRSSNSIRIDYLNEDNGHSLSVHVYPKDFKIKSEKDESFSLSNGIKAKIIDDKRIDFIFITFIDNDLKYLIGINKNMFENSKACTEELIKVANSMK